MKKANKDIVGTTTGFYIYYCDEPSVAEHGGHYVNKRYFWNQNFGECGRRLPFFAML